MAQPTHMAPAPINLGAINTPDSSYVLAESREVGTRRVYKYLLTQGVALGYCSFGLSGQLKAVFQAASLTLQQPRATPHTR